MSSIVKKVVFGGMAALALVIALSAAPTAKASWYGHGYGHRFIGAGCCNRVYAPWGGCGGGCGVYNSIYYPAYFGAYGGCGGGCGAGLWY